MHTHIHYVLQALMECVNEGIGEREQEGAMRILLRLSQSLAVQHMTTLPGLYYNTTITHDLSLSLSLSFQTL